MPSENPFYYQVERGISSLVNALKSDTVTIAEASYTAATLTPDTNTRNAMFPPSSVRVEAINMERLIVGQICLADGHPRRSDFVSAVEMVHGDPLPSSVGGIGAVTEGQGKKALYYENRPADVVDALRSGEQIDVGAADARVERIWGWDGASFFLPHDSKVLVEIFGPGLPVYNDYTELTALFSTTSPVVAQLHVEFQAAWQCGAAAVLAAKVGTFEREASDYWQKFMTLMAAQKTPIKVDLDYASRGSQ
jgi:hypothetical protein